MLKIGSFVCVLIVSLGSSLDAQTPRPATTVDASRGGVTVSSGPNSLTVGARVQFRWIVDERESFDADTAGSGLGRDDGIRSQFDVPRMRVTLSGGAFQPWMRYSFQFELNRTSGEGDSKIKDAFIEIRPPGQPFRMTAGQFKAPFGLQQLTSSGRLQFVDRAITDSKFNPARDMGVMVGGAAAANKFGYAIGLFNGSGESVRQLNRAHLWAARVYVDPLGEYALSEGSIDATDRTILHLGFAARGGEPIRGRAPATVFEDPDNQAAYNVEFALKSRLLYSTAEYYWMTDERENPSASRDLDSRGYHLQAGAVVISSKGDIGIRYAEIDPDTQVDAAKLREVRGVFGYYWRGHNLKVQADIGQLRWSRNFASLPAVARSGLPGLGNRLVRGDTLSDTEFRLQFQLAF